ncbi:MAG TPA: hypothetical protein DGG95_16400 [Cytophagales bacterium]|jgi:hypothetical protein|nr:hypothetical protein [Cytophagales bacterium]
MSQIIGTLGFPFITLVFYGWLLFEFKKAIKRSSLEASQQRKIFNRILIALIAWAVFVSGWSLSGMMQNFDRFPFNVAPVILIPFIGIVLFTFSTTAKEILLQLKPEAIIRIQFFRFFVELIIWALFLQKLLPIQMTFEGRNLDIISGISAPLIAWLLANQKISKTVVIVWNIACLGLLINIVTVAILSMPTPAQYFFNEPYNTAVAKFPYVFLPAFLVPLAYMLHFFSIRQMLIRK